MKVIVEVELSMGDVDDPIGTAGECVAGMIEVATRYRSADHPYKPRVLGARERKAKR